MTGISDSYARAPIAPGFFGNVISLTTSYTSIDLSDQSGSSYVERFVSFYSASDVYVCVNDGTAPNRNSTAGANKAHLFPGGQLYLSAFSIRKGAETLQVAAVSGTPTFEWFIS